MPQKNNNKNQSTANSRETAVSSVSNSSDQIKQAEPGGALLDTEARRMREAVLKAIEPEKFRAKELAREKKAEVIKEVPTKAVPEVSETIKAPAPSFLENKTIFDRAPKMPIWQKIPFGLVVVLLALAAIILYLWFLKYCFSFLTAG